MIPKKFIALILFAALVLVRGGMVYAQGKPDSGKWPWKLPFSIVLNANFEAHHEIDSDFNSGSGNSSVTTYDAPDNAGIQFVVDSESSVTLAGNTLSIDSTATANYGEYTINQDLSITFDSTWDSILTLSCSFDETFNGNWIGSQSEWSFTFSGLRFDTSSLIYPYSSLSHVQFSFGNGTWETPSGYLLVRTSENSYQLLGITLGGIFRADTLTDPAVVSNSTQSSKILLQSYPNPFSQSSTILFTPITSGYADISLLNLLGAEVAHLFSGELAAGEHSFVWSNPTGLPDGTYECLIRFNGQVQTLPMVLMH